MRTQLAIVALAAILFGLLVPDRARQIRQARRLEVESHARSEAQFRRGFLEEEAERLFFDRRADNPGWMRTVAICRIRARLYAKAAEHEGLLEHHGQWGVDHPFSDPPPVPSLSVDPTWPLPDAEIDAEVEAMRSIKRYQ